MDNLDALIDWKVYKVLGIKEDILKGEHTMRYQFTIELRVDYEDKGKNDVMRKAVGQAARHMFSTAALLSDKIPPDIAIFTDDFFTGAQEIKMMDDVIVTGNNQLTEAGSDDSSENVSQELLDALK